MARVRELMRMVHLDPEVYGGRYPAELSGGQQQRIGVIRAMAADPPIILMDEPFSALDPISREQLQDELVRLQEAIRKTIVFVAHDIDEALKIGRICILNGGRIVQFDTPERILRHPANEFVKNFIGENRLSRAEPYPEIADVMVRPIVSDPERGLAAAIRLMRIKKVDTLRACGIYQEENITLQDVMQQAQYVVHVEQPLTEAIQLISKHRIAYLPVFDRQDIFLGVITRASLVDIMAEQF